MEFTLDDFLKFIQDKGELISTGGTIEYQLGDNYKIQYDTTRDENKGILSFYKGVKVREVDLRIERNAFKNELYNHDNIYDLIDTYYYTYIRMEEEKNKAKKELEKYFKK